MRIVLLQDEILLPSFGGGIKANRCLLEELSLRGHQCYAMTRALTRSTEGPNDPRQFTQYMASRNIEVAELQRHVWSFTHNGIHVNALDFADDDSRMVYLEHRIRELDPDWVVVADDKRRIMLETALRTASDRIILLLQTIVQLPFGPLSVDPNPDYARMLKSTRATVVISRFMREYMQTHGGTTAHLMRLPVYGSGPYPDLGCFDEGFVTMINPCELKGVDIFLQLAQAFPDVPFAAVPTWGTGQDILDRLGEHANVALLAPEDNIERILARTRILLVPSLWPETFGYVVPEAMLRGIPVLASDVGGLPEAKLGVDYTLPVVPGRFEKNRFVSPRQELGPWRKALRTLLSNEFLYRSCAAQSRKAALEFVGQVSAEPFEQLMNRLARAS